MGLREIILDLLNLGSDPITDPNDEIELKFFRTDNPTIIEQRLYYTGTDQEVPDTKRVLIRVIPRDPYDSQKQEAKTYCG